MPTTSIPNPKNRMRVRDLCAKAVFIMRLPALPKAAKLPKVLVAKARTLKTYDEGTWFESVRIAPNGTIFLSANRGEDFMTGDKSRCRSQIIARDPDGAERVFFDLPIGSTAGVFAFGPDGTVYMTGQGAELGVWRFRPNSQPELFCPLPRGSWPNGLAFGPDGQLYAPDSLLGCIWRIEPGTGQASKAVEHPTLRRRAVVAIAPGANGLQFFGREMFVTVSDTTAIQKFRLDEDGRFGMPECIATGIPGDDFAIDPTGTLYVTTHPYNTIVRVTPNGDRVIVADSSHGITGATDAAFGVLPGDEHTLYVVTDGGAFEGNMRARGKLVALQLTKTT